jgi:uncharacterized protein with FMN-binding domain
MLFVFLLLGLMSPGIPKQDFRVRDVDVTAIDDGRYVGTFRIVPPLGTFVANRRFTVEVIVAGHAIESLRVIEPQRLQAAWPELQARVVETQSIALDGLSGATWSKLAYLKAAERALTAR